MSLACSAIAAISNPAQAQKIDLAFGVSTTLAPAPLFTHGAWAVPPLSGGAYPGLSGDVLFWHNVGFGAEMFWRASQGENYLQDVYGPGLNYRPTFYNFDAVYSPKLASHTYLELVAGMGALDTHFYSCNSCSQLGGSSLISSSNHFDGDFGAGIKFYLKGGLFIRPEARVYVINNNTA